MIHMINPANSENPAILSKGHLLRVLGVGFGVAVIIGNTIGAVIQSARLDR